MIKTLIQITFIIMLQALCSNTFAQARIGSTESQIRKDFSEYSFEVGRTDNNIKHISYEDADMLAVYYLNDENVCFACAIFPKKQGILNYLVEKYNKNYVIISDTKWKMYSDNGIIDIELIFDDGTSIIRFSSN